jgi:hypothetical protein
VVDRGGTVDKGGKEKGPFDAWLICGVVGRYYNMARSRPVPRLNVAHVQCEGLVLHDHNIHARALINQEFRRPVPFST